LSSVLLQIAIQASQRKRLGKEPRLRDPGGGRRSRVPWGKENEQCL